MSAAALALRCNAAIFPRMLTILLAVMVCGGGNLADPGDPIYLNLAPDADQSARPYLRAGLLVSFPHEWEGLDFDPGFGAYVAGGFQWDIGRQSSGDTVLCADVQYKYRSADFEEIIFNPFGGFTEVDGSFTFHSVLVNGVLLLNATDLVAPYVGAGAGVSYGVLEVEDEDDDGLAPELQVMIGVLFRVRENIHAEVGASYTYAFHTLEDESGNSSSAAVDIVTANFGVRVRL